MGEEWRPAPGFEECYAVSSLGRVYSIRRQRLLAPSHDADGYLRIRLNRGGKRFTYKLHRLVAFTFHAGKHNALHNEVAHLDGVRQNCRADNLKWVSKVENHSHKRLHGTHQAGEAHPRAKLTERDVRELLARMACGESIHAVASSFGMSRSAVEDIRYGKRWRHIERPSEFDRPFSQAGSRNHNAKFTEAEAAMIRFRRANGETCQAIADYYGVWKGTISRIARRQAYRSDARL